MSIALSNPIGPIDCHGAADAVLDDSKVAIGSADFHGASIELGHTGGASATLTIHPSGQTIDTHRHDWPCLSIHMIGTYYEEHEDGVASIDGPAAVLHPVGRPHADRIGARGLETVVIEFDPSWLRTIVGAPHRLDRSRYWLGGALGREAAALGRSWIRSGSPDLLWRMTAQFLEHALADDAPTSHPQPWIQTIAHRIANACPDSSTTDVAKAFDLHPAWVARAYRMARGEGIQDALRRQRVEMAVDLLRTTSDRLAEIAIAAGFCDQSHMTRAFQIVLGRTPLAVRREAALLAAYTALRSPN